MPVWHEATREARDAGRLEILGITQEQHPARCRLFAQWHGIDWPILWDPFNLTGSKVVPHFTLVDEHGVIRKARAKPEDLDAFLETTWPAPSARAPEEPSPACLVAPVPSAAPDRAAWPAVRALLEAAATDTGADPADAIRALATDAAAHPDDPAAAFRLGVAYRLRHDGPHRQDGDFQRALDAWSRALQGDPSQYIWRRRIQQFGPRLDKPYAFYGWVEEARRDVEARGESPVPLEAELTWSERFGKEGLERTAPEAPDPQGKLPRDDEGLVRIETAVVHDSAEERRAVEVHVMVRPNDPPRFAWHADAEDAILWIEDPAEGGPWLVEPRGLAVAPSADDERGELIFELEVRPGEGAEGPVTLRGYVALPVCRDDDGTCLWLRKDVEIVVPAKPGG